MDAFDAAPFNSRSALVASGAEVWDAIALRESAYGVAPGTAPGAGAACRGAFGGAFGGALGGLTVPGAAFDAPSASANVGASSSRTSRSGAEVGHHVAARFLAPSSVPSVPSVPSAERGGGSIEASCAEAEQRAEYAEAELARVKNALAEAQQRHRDANQLLRRLGDANASLRSELEHARGASRGSAGESAPLSVSQSTPDSLRLARAQCLEAENAAMRSALERTRGLRGSSPRSRQAATQETPQGAADSLTSASLRCLEVELEQERREVARLRSRCQELERSCAAAVVQPATLGAGDVGLLNTELQALRHRVWALDGELQERKRHALAADAAAKVAAAAAGSDTGVASVALVAASARTNEGASCAAASPVTCLEPTRPCDAVTAFELREVRDELRSGERRLRGEEQHCAALAQELHLAREDAHSANEEVVTLTQMLEHAGAAAQASSQRSASIVEELQDVQASAQASYQQAAGHEARFARELEAIGMEARAALTSAEVSRQQEAEMEVQWRSRDEAADSDRKCAEACAHQWRNAFSGCEDKVRGLLGELEDARVAGRGALTAEELPTVFVSEHVRERVAQCLAVAEGAVAEARAAEETTRSLMSELSEACVAVHTAQQAEAEAAERATTLTIELSTREAEFLSIAARRERQERTQRLELSGTTAAVNAWRQRCDSERASFGSRQANLEEQTSAAIQEASNRNEAFEAARVEADDWQRRAQSAEAERQHLQQRLDLAERSCQEHAGNVELQKAVLQRQESAASRALAAAERRCAAAERVEADGMVRGEAFQEVMASVEDLQRQNLDLRKECQALHGQVCEELNAAALVGESLERAQRRVANAESTAGSLREDLKHARAALRASGGTHASSPRPAVCCGPPPARPPRQSAATAPHPLVTQPLSGRVSQEIQALRHEIREAKGASPLGDVTRAWQRVEGLEANESSIDSGISKLGLVLAASAEESKENWTAIAKAFPAPNAPASPGQSLQQRRYPEESQENQTRGRWGGPAPAPKLALPLVPPWSPRSSSSSLVLSLGKQPVSRDDTLSASSISTSDADEVTPLS